MVCGKRVNLKAGTVLNECWIGFPGACPSLIGLFYFDLAGQEPQPRRGRCIFIPGHGPRIAFGVIFA